MSLNRKGSFEVMRNIAPPFLVLSFAMALMLACSLFTGPANPPEKVSETAADESPDPTSFTLVVLHPSQGKLPSLLKTHAEQATQLGRNPFVEFSAEWCPPCKALAASLSDPRMVDAFRGTYIIRLDLDEWKSQLGRSGFNVPGVPAFYELDEAGRPSGKMITGGAWGEDIPENMAPPLQAFFQGNSTP
jgi:thiol-disulfide isomerase/thioredoxin